MLHKKKQQKKRKEKKVKYKSQYIRCILTHTHIRTHILYINKYLQKGRMEGRTLPCLLESSHLKMIKDGDDGDDDGGDGDDGSDDGDDDGDDDDDDGSGSRRKYFQDEIKSPKCFSGGRHHSSRRVECVLCSGTRSDAKIISEFRPLVNLP